MSERRSISSSQIGSHESGSKSATKSSRSMASFQLFKCPNCQLDLLKKDFNKHESVCNNLNASREILSNYSLPQSIERHLFEFPFIINRRILFTSSIIGINKDKLKKNCDILIPDDENLILLSPELMEHCNLSNGQCVSLLVIDNSNISQKDFLLVQSYDQFKSCLTIALIKDSFYFKKFSNQDGMIFATVKIDFGISTVKLKTLNLEIKGKFSDPLVYLKSCCTIKNGLVNKVITSIGQEFDFKIKDIQLKLHVKHFSSNVCTDQLESDLLNLNIFETSSKSPTFDYIYLVCDETIIIFSSTEDQLATSNIELKMAGYLKQMQMLKMLIMRPLEGGYDLPIPRTILLTGPSGTGKTLAMKEIFEQVREKMNFIKIHCSLFLSKTFEFEKLKSAFKNLNTLRPSLLFLDNLEDISTEKNQLEKRLLSWLKTLLDELSKKEPVIIVAATSKPEILDSSLRRPGRFDIEVEFSIPSSTDRKLILCQFLHTIKQCDLDDEQISSLAESAHGFTGADLKHFCEIAALHALDSEMPNRFDFWRLSETLAKIKPSVMREITLEKPNVHWSDIGGLHSLRQLLEETIVWPVKHPEAFVRLGIDPPRGVLMYGPPGCCKTMIGKALATESGLNFFSIKGPELFSKWVGESERAIREMFRKARTAAPSILFFDEIDALAAERGQSQSTVGDRVLAQLLTEIDGVEKLNQVVIVAATNRPDIVDKALLRPGRLDSMVYVPLPDLATRREIFLIHTKKMRLHTTIETERHHLIEELANKSSGYTGAEVSAICQRAGLIALSENLSAHYVTREHFVKAFERVRPQIGADMIAFYDEFANSGDQLKSHK